jgi:hypothetical protein
VVEPKLHYETTDPDEITDLATVLRTGPGNVGHCMRNGTLVYEIESSTGIRRISLHHGVTLRAENEFENVPLLNPDACRLAVRARHRVRPRGVRAGSAARGGVAGHHRRIG